MFTRRPDQTTYVSISHSGFTGSAHEATQRALDSMGGFSFFVLAGLKPLLEHGVELNLVAGHYPDAHVPPEG